MLQDEDTKVIICHQSRPSPDSSWRVELVGRVSRTLQGIRDQVIDEQIKFLYSRVEAVLKFSSHGPEMCCISLQKRQLEHLSLLEDELSNLHKKRLQKKMVYAIHQRSWVEILFELRRMLIEFPDELIVGVSYRPLSLTPEMARLFFSEFEGSRVTLCQIIYSHSLRTEGEIRFIAFPSENSLNSLFIYKIIMRSTHELLLPMALLARLFSLHSYYCVSFNEMVQMYEAALVQQIISVKLQDQKDSKAQDRQKGLRKKSQQKRDPRSGSQGKSVPPQQTELLSVISQGLECALKFLKNMVDHNDATMALLVINCLLLGKGIGFDHTNLTKHDVSFVDEFESMLSRKFLREKFKELVDQSLKKQRKERALEFTAEVRCHPPTLLTKFVHLLRNQYCRVEKSCPDWYFLKDDRFLARKNPNLQSCLVNALKVRNQHALVQDPAKKLWSVISSEPGELVDLKSCMEGASVQKPQFQYAMAVCKRIGVAGKPERKNKSLMLQRTVFGTATFRKTRKEE